MEPRLRSGPVHVLADNPGRLTEVLLIGRICPLG
jgi:hypothetical protein